MPEYAGAQYNQASSGWAGMAAETTALTPDATTLGAAPTLALMGYANVPGISMAEGTTPIYAAGTYKPVAFLPGRREASVSGTVTLGTGPGPRDLIKAAIRQSGLSGATSLCQNLVAIAGGALDVCSDGGAYGWMVRHALINTLSISGSAGQPIQVGFSAMGAVGVRTATAPTVSHAALVTSGGIPLGWQHVQFIIGGTDYTPILTSFNFSLSNNAVYKLMRRELSGGDSNVLSRTPRDIQPGNEVNTFSLGLADRLPATLTDGGATSTRWPAVSLILGDGTNSHTFAFADGALGSLASSPVEAGGEFAFSSEVMAGGLTYSYA